MNASADQAQITVCIVDGHPADRASIEQAIKKDPGLVCVGSFANAESALPEMARKKPDVIILDYAAPDLKGGLCIRRFRAKSPKSRVLVLSKDSSDGFIFDVLEAGAEGLLDKEKVSIQELLSEIRLVHSGVHPLSEWAWRLTLQALHGYHTHHSKPDILTARESEVAELMRQGKSNEEIARKLGVALSTIQTHVRNIFIKTDSHKRQEAVFKLWGSHDSPESGKYEKV